MQGAAFELNRTEILAHILCVTDITEDYTQGV